MGTISVVPKTAGQLRTGSQESSMEQSGTLYGPEYLELRPHELGLWTQTGSFKSGIAQLRTLVHLMG